MTKALSSTGTSINERSTGAGGAMIVQQLLGFVIALFGVLFLFAFAGAFADAVKKAETIKFVYALAAGGVACLFFALARSLALGNGVPIWFARLLVIGTLSMLTFAAVKIWMAPEIWPYVPMLLISLIHFPQFVMLLWSGKYKGDIAGHAT